MRLEISIHVIIMNLFVLLNRTLIGVEVFYCCLAVSWKVNMGDPRNSFWYMTNVTFGLHPPVVPYHKTVIDTLRLFTHHMLQAQGPILCMLFNYYIIIEF